MTHYVVGHLKGLRDAEKLAEYRKVAADASAKHGGPSLRRQLRQRGSRAMQKGRKQLFSCPFRTQPAP